MTIARTDLKLRASQRMSDAADGGGAMTSVVVTDSTPVFDNISETARLVGSWSCRKLFASVENADGTPFLGAQVMLDSRPNDDQSSIMLFRPATWASGTGAAQERPAVVSEMAAELASTTDGGPKWYGSRSITAAAPAGSTTVQLSSVYSRIVPVEPTDTPMSGSFTVRSSYAYSVNIYGATKPLVVNLDIHEQLFTWPAGANNYRIITLDHPAIVPSIDVAWTDAAGFSRQARHGENVTLTDGTVLSVYLYPPPAPGSQVSVHYARSDQLVIVSNTGVTQAELKAGYVVSPPAGTSFHSAWVAQSKWLSGPADYYSAYFVDASAGLVDYEGVISGSYDATTHVVRIPGCKPLEETLASTPADVWVFVKPQAGGTTKSFKIQITANLVLSSIDLQYDGQAAASDTAGVIVGPGLTGRYSPSSGLLELGFDAAWSGQVEWTGASRTSKVVDDREVHPFDPLQVPPSGNVKVLREGDIVVVHNSQQLAARNVVAGEVVACGRTALAQIRIIGSDGIEIPPSSGWVEGLAAGTATVTSTTGWAQPVVIEHRVEDAAILTDVSGTSLATLSRPLTHAYPAGTSWMSRPMLLGDRRAAVQDGWALTTWTGVWEAVVPAPDDALYAQALYPIEVTNRGAASEDWALVFTSATAYYVLGRTLGVIAFGNTAADCSPINPATGAPYFTVRAVGWGTGWSAGNAWRFSTSGTAVPFWAVRCVSPRDLSDVEQRAVIVLRGSV